MNTQTDPRSFENLAFKHIKAIFRNAVLNDGSLDTGIDIRVTSENERLLLFQVKFIKNDRQLSSSEYLKTLSFKEWIEQLYPGLSPVIILISNVDASLSLRSALRKSSIVFIKIGNTPEETRHELEKAFQSHGIQVSELGSTKRTKLPNKGSCYVAFSHSENREQILSAIKEIIEKAGYRAITAEDNAFSENFYSNAQRAIEKCNLVIADITEHNPNVMLELGIAMGSRKPVLILEADSKTQLPLDIRGAGHICYESSSRGINQLESLLNEKLITFQFSEEHKD